MTRRCDTCEWSVRPEHSRGLLSCREGPVIQPVYPDHWCSRWKLAERLADGRDARAKANG